MFQPGKIEMKIRNGLALVVSASFLGLTVLANAQPIGEMWLTAGDQLHMYKVSGGVVTQFALTNNEYGIAVFGSAGAADVRTQGGSSSTLGAKYLNGVATGTTYVTPVTAMLDGTQDVSTNSIFAMQWSGGDVYKYNQNWGSQTLLFNAQGSDGLGITFDRRDSSLYCLDRNGAFISHYTQAGTLLGSFTTQASLAGLAIDTDGTLWTLRQGTGTLQHYNTAGSLLGTFALGNTDNILGMEIVQSAVPEPVSCLTLSVGALALLRRKRAKA